MVQRINAISFPLCYIVSGESDHKLWTTYVYNNHLRLDTVSILITKSVMTKEIL